MVQIGVLIVQIGRLRTEEQQLIQIYIALLRKGRLCSMIQIRALCLKKNKTSFFYLGFPLLFFLLLILLCTGLPEKNSSLPEKVMFEGLVPFSLQQVVTPEYASQLRLWDNLGNFFCRYFFS